jgi:hypothetical protein
MALGRMVYRWKRRSDEAARMWRALSACIAGWFVAMTIVAFNPLMPAGAIPHENASSICVSMVASEQNPLDLSGHALACHMHFEHHQLVRSENACMLPILDTVRERHLTRVNPPASLAPSPPEKPPRA